MTKAIRTTPTLAPEESEPGRLPLVSIIIAAYNESEHISRCLDSLSHQTYAPIEIIVVDDGSTDHTADLAANFLQVKLVRLPRRAHRFTSVISAFSAAAARNAGAQRASGEIFVFLDADMSFPPEFIRKLTAPMLERRVLGTFSREILVANMNRRWARAHRLGRELPLESHFPPGFPDRWENFRAIWSDAFRRVGGFEEVGYFEDMTLAKKLGELADVAPGAVCWHYEPETLRDIIRSAVWMGRGERLRDGTNVIRVVHRPHTTLKSAVRLSLRHRSPSLFVYRITWDTAVLVGWLQGGSVKK